MTRLQHAASAGLLLVLVVGVGAAVGAKPGEKTRAAVLQAIIDCRAMKDSDKRLACYDDASNKLDEAEASGQVVVMDREHARQVRRDIFGLQLPSLSLFETRDSSPGTKRAASDDVDRVTDTIKRAWAQPDRKLVLELAGGAVWRQIDAVELDEAPRPGTEVEIKRAALGSFMLKVKGQPAFRAHRDR